MSFGLLKEAVAIASDVKSKATTAFGISNSIVNKIAGLLDGCVQIPPRAENIHVFFVIDMDGENHYVAGNLLSEKGRIVAHLLDNFKYVIFKPTDVKDVGLPTIVSGEENFELYRNADKSMMMTLRQKYPSNFFIAADADAEYLKLRMETLGIGVVYTRDEMNIVLNKYIDKSRHIYKDKECAIYQCILDIAMSL